MDRGWWNTYKLEVDSDFAGQRFTVSHDAMKFGAVRLENFATYGNSGASCVTLAIKGGATKVILLGFDCQKTNGMAHWHGDHPSHLGNARRIEGWREKFQELRDNTSIEIINCSRETALDMFERRSLEQEIGDKPAIHIEGMHGLGDNLHQRGVIRQLMDDYEVWLDSPWPCLYHDLDIHVRTKGTRLRTQAKNAEREQDKFDMLVVPRDAKQLRVSYPPSMVREHGSVYAAMSAQCGVPMGDFSLPVPAEWTDRADKLIKSWNTDKPILIYRPLVERKEWGGCHTRNPDIEAYHALIESVRERFFVVSVADLVPDVEWTVCKPIQADATFHAGELDIEILTGLVKRSALVFTSPGFALILAQSVGTPVVGVFGGYEDSSSFTPGEKYAPCLWVDPIVPCQCFSHTHKCKKAIDVPKWLPLLDEFAQRAI